jgi:hypothetical protein
LGIAILAHTAIVNHYLKTSRAKKMSTPERMGIDSGRRNRIPRPLTEDERARLDEFLDGIHYSTRYECCKR